MIFYSLSNHANNRRLYFSLLYSWYYNRFIGSHSKRFNVFPWNQQRQSGQGNANEVDYAVFMRPLERPCHYENLVDALFF